MVKGFVVNDGAHFTEDRLESTRDDAVRKLHN